MFWFFGKKEEVKDLKEEVRSSFENVKKDFGKISNWIHHLDGKDKKNGEDITYLKNEIFEIKNSIQELKDFVSIFGTKIGQINKQPQTAVDKQTAVEAVQTPVQTAVQTTFLSNLSVMERAIVWTLLNSEMKLSYEDLAALMGKDKSTIRGQINAIRRKSDGLIEESIELNGKKRVFVPEKMKTFLLKSVKVRVKNKKRGGKAEKTEEESAELDKGES
jgi:predicted transcriptional regulator